MEYRVKPLDAETDSVNHVVQETWNESGEQKGQERRRTDHGEKAVAFVCVCVPAQHLPVFH